MEVERVQEIAMRAKAMDSIPMEYVRSEMEQPAITTVHGSPLEVPAVDLGDPDQDRLVGFIARASSEWGLFQVVNHGIPSELIKKLQQVGKEFFELPQEEKEKCAKREGGEEGYGTKLQKEMQGKKSWVDHLFHRIWPHSSINFQFWPQNPPSYREVNEEYAKYLRGVANKLFKCLSLGLGLEAHELEQAGGGDDVEYLLKINYYPPCPRPDLTLGVVAHTDMCLFTVLVPNDVAGLQVSRDGQWYDVKYIPNALIVHIGDQIEIMSNGKYKAVLHRTTVNKEKTRMSWPVFLEPPANHVVGPLPKLVNEDNRAKFKIKKYIDYKYSKLNKLPQ